MQPAYIKGDNEQRNVFIFGNPDYDAMLETPGDPPDYIALTSPAAISGMQHQREQISEHHQWSEMLYSDDLKAYEAELLESLYASSGFQTNLFLFDSAGEKEIKALQSPFTLHLSLHGYFMENQDFDPSIYQDNRLLRSGILFSGSNRFLEGDVPSLSLNDGLLTTYEIYNLNLASTSLVYLSACETGLGIVANDNAMKSFVKAFQFAGAESVIMSLWTTEPEYEIEFMNLYYYYWLFEDLSKHAAFFKAQNQMRITYERPYFWGSFILLEE
jgi:CHAT domain-containing protein